VAPFGCHPTASHGYYTYDEAHLKGYLKASKAPESYNEYLNQYVSGITEEEYSAVVGSDRLAQLQTGGGTV